MLEKKEFQYKLILDVINEFPFPVGKNLLIDFLKGNFKNRSIKKNKLFYLKNFSSLKSFSVREIENGIEGLIKGGLIDVYGLKSNRSLKLLRITKLGYEDMENPSSLERLESSPLDEKNEISEEDRIKFRELGNFLERYNDYQKKAIISDKEKILCVAGAGTGKTSVLAKRIEFLIKYKGVESQRILAITFTRKARQEMLDRLVGLGINVGVETFNSFCEKILNRYYRIIYGRETKIMSYGNKVIGLMSALNHLKASVDEVIEKYFSEFQRKNKKREELFNVFMNDCFFVLEYFKSRNLELYDFSKDVPEKDRENARLLYRVCVYLREYMKIAGFRDYTDQIVDCINFLKNNKEKIPRFEHLLIDEYQDVNNLQMELIDLLNSRNLFVVGDPRQSIFGWRGSDIRYILNFKEKYKDCETINLIENYRSNKHIVRFMNLSIKEMNLPDIISGKDENKEIYLFNFENESSEFEFVVEKILSLDVEKHDIFVLARTNRQLFELSQIMKQKNIPYIIKNDESNEYTTEKRGHVVLATIHAIKGMEARVVFVIGVNESNFPCKASDHPVIEMIKVEEYDKEGEEKRLFYVAISRAKEKIFLTYSGKRCSSFINEEMKKMVDQKIPNSLTDSLTKNISLKTRLDEFRRSKEKDL